MSIVNENDLFLHFPYKDADAEDLAEGYPYVRLELKAKTRDRRSKKKSDVVRHSILSLDNRGGDDGIELLNRVISQGHKIQGFGYFPGKQNRHYQAYSKVINFLVNRLQSEEQMRSKIESEIRAELEAKASKSSKVVN